MNLLKIPRKTLFVLCASSSLLIAGCSSSDNSRPSSNAVSTPQQNNPDVTSTSVAGNVLKGTVKNADVHIYPISKGKLATNPLASTKTDDQGLFSVKIPTKAADAVYIEVVASPNGSSRMTCDTDVCGIVGEIDGEDTNNNGVLEFGEDIVLSDDFKLSTIIQDYQSSPQLKVSVTPVSHLAAQRVKKKGKFSNEEINAELAILAELLNFPTELSQAIALDITKAIDGDVDPESLRYALYNAAVARYAHQKHLTIPKAIEKIDAELFYDNGDVNRGLLLELLHHAKHEAKRITKGRPDLQHLISEILLVITRYECIPGDPCGPIKPPLPPKPPVGELAKVKEFVKDFRGWLRNLTQQNETALANFKARTESLGKLWEDDVKILASALNDVLPGIGQAVSPSYSFCYYCESDGLISIAAVEKELVIGDLVYRLHSDGTLDVEGSIHGVGVDIQLQLPPIDEWATSHSIDIAAGRLSREDIQLVIAKGSTINAVFPNSTTPEEIIDQIENDQIPVISQLSAAVKFTIEAKYGLAQGGVIDFESAPDSNLLDTNDWSIVSGKANSGTSSLRAPAIGNNDSTQISSTFNTWGGYLSFAYAVESEASYDFFNVYVDGQRVLSASGYQPKFENAYVFLAPGEHTIVWEYIKDDSVGHNQDTVWIDDIQFPLLVGDSSVDVVSHNLLTGNLTATAYKLDEPWQLSPTGYIPGEITLNAKFSNKFLVGSGIEEDDIQLKLSAVIQNAADFVPPQPYDEGTLQILGNYTVAPNLFTFNLQNWSIHITPTGTPNTYLYELYRKGDEDPIQSYLATSTRATLREVAGDLIPNSGIGRDVVVPQEGLYITTLVGSSPWGVYPNSRFSAAGGNIYGYLVTPYDPTETDDQFLKIAVSLEAELKPFDLPHLTFGSKLIRDKLNEGTFSFYIIVDGKRFNFNTQYWYHLPGYGGSDESVDLKKPKLVIENQHGVKLDLAFPDVEDVGSKDNPELEGKLVYNNKVYGTIKRVKGIITIEYIDNTGESIP